MKLYKYRSMKSRGNREIFENNQIYLSMARDFNDPFDCRPALRTNYSDQEIETYVQYLSEEHLSHLPPDERKRQESESREQFKNPEELSRRYYELLNRYGIYSLSATYTNILLWSHYADKHTGFCIEFDRGNELPPFIDTLEVVYSERRPVVDMMLTKDDSKLEEIFRRVLLTKANDWRYEEEWRLIHLRRVGYFEFSEPLLTKVILGARILDKDAQQVMAWVRGRSSPVTIWKAQLSNELFGLEFEELSP